MKKTSIAGTLATAMLLAGISTVAAFETDTIGTSAGNLTITFIGHGTLMFGFQGKVIHVDPWSELGDYTALPKADLVLITHEHPDHCDPAALGKIKGKETVILANQGCSALIGGGMVLKNGDKNKALGIAIAAVPAYNLVHLRSKGQPFHTKGAGNGYVLTFGDKSVYVAGDTEGIPEMDSLKSIDIAFLPMNLPYTMTPEMAAAAARRFNPKILYPYHYGDTDPARLAALLKPDAVEVRVRSMR